MWTVRQVCFQEKEKNVVLFLISTRQFKKCHSEVFSRTQTSVFPVEVFAMDRFVSKRSSSSVDLDASSLDDVRAERAAIALSVGLSWPPDRYTKQTRGRPSRQQLWERALQDHILEHHELPHGVRLQRPVWWRPGEAIDRPAHNTRRSPTPRLPVPRQPLQPPHSLKTSPAAVVRSAARSRSTPSPATGSSTCWTSGKPSGTGTCGGACARSSAFARECATGSTRTRPIAGSGARHEQRRAAGEACCHPLT